MLALLSHKPIRGWISGLRDQAQEHLYGPPQLYVEPTSTSDTAEDSAHVTDHQADPDDGFDYSIYHTGT